MIHGDKVQFVYIPTYADSIGHVGAVNVACNSSYSNKGEMASFDWGTNNYKLREV